MPSSKTRGSKLSRVHMPTPVVIGQCRTFTNTDHPYPFNTPTLLLWGTRDNFDIEITMQSVSVFMERDAARMVARLPASTGISPSPVCRASYSIKRPVCLAHDAGVTFLSRETLLNQIYDSVAGRYLCLIGLSLHSLVNCSRVFGRRPLLS